MEISILVTDGSPLGVTLQTLYGNDPLQVGVGGAECALLTLCEWWHKTGHTIKLYNNPRDKYGSPFEQLNLSDFDESGIYDVLIVFRTPSQRIINAKANIKIFFSCDQYTSKPFKGFDAHVDKIVCISPFHADYFKEAYGISADWIDLPVRIDDFVGDITKSHKQFISTSVPGRGLEHLFQAWPVIQKEIPESKLTITSDYRLWGATRNDGVFVGQSLFLSGVQYPGALPRPKYAKRLLKAEIMTYFCTYPELFCIAVAEAQVAGIYTITSDEGALATTNMVQLVSGNLSRPEVRYEYVRLAREFLEKSDEERLEISTEIRNRAIERFSPDNILRQWDEKVFK